MPAAIPASFLPARHKTREECLPTGFVILDQSLGGLPRGAVTELTGPRSSGKTSLLHSVLAQAAGRQECCAVIDTNDAFDPDSAARSGVELSRLVWVRCRGNAESAVKAADLLVHGGGFGVVCLDLSEVAPKVLQRIPISWWWRFRRAIERTPAVLLILGDQPSAKSCSLCWLELRQAKVRWSGRKPFLLLRGMDAEVVIRKPAGFTHVRLSLHAR